MNLLQLAPNIQEEILFLPRMEIGREQIHMRELQPIMAIWDWRKQRQRWKQLMENAEVGGR
jgi:hypothetical protein